MEATCMPRKKKTVQNLAAVTEPLTVETSTNDLRARLDEIKAYDGVIGYILRNSTSAAIDLKDPTKIIDYAILSSSALDASQEMSELFNLGDVKDIIVEGKDVKVLSLTVDENKISVFMEKNADCGKILKKLRAA
ncbi:roadblock/LC7 domain-containing protein [Candidatus Bathyarchaeota archaeon]|nr:MAG: roadblock/LC7 domain-containing protein [Candidatus Bathyarchaeota archaeon]